MHQCDSKDNGKHLFAYYKEITKNYLFEVVVPHVRGQNGDTVLSAYLKSWNDFAMLTTLLQRMFVYLDRLYLKEKNLGTLGTTALDMFVMFFKEIQAILRTEMLILFTKDRNGEVINRDLLRDIVESFVKIGMKNAEPKKRVNGFTWEGTDNLDLYEKEFEHYFLINARQEYQGKANLWVQECSAPEYLKNVEAAIDHEENKNKDLF